MRPSKSATIVLSLAVFAAIGVILLGPISTVVADNTGTANVTDENVTVDSNSTYYDLRGYDIDASTVVVEAPNGSGYEQTNEYELNESEGTIRFNTSGSIIDLGENVRVDYDYQASDPTTALVIGFIPVGVGLLIFAVIGRRVQSVMG